MKTKNIYFAENKVKTKVEKTLSIAIIGETNSGKSTLLNAIVGKKVAIVTPKAQTTRTKIIGIKNIANTQLIFIDTPGVFRKIQKKGDELLLKLAIESLKSNQLVIFLVDATAESKQEFNANNKNILENFHKNQKVILIINKIDLINKNNQLPIIKKFADAFTFERVFCISALKKDGIEDLEKYLCEISPNAPHLYPEDQISNMPEKMFVNELTREKLMISLEKELPYSFKVETEKWEENAKALKIYQIIFVQNDNHRKIILGKNGSFIKQIGINARKELEEIFEKKVSLFLFVKIRKEEF